MSRVITFISTQKRYIKAIGFILISALLFTLFQSNKTIHPTWLVPYLSGAKNLTLSQEWFFSLQELNEIKENGSNEFFTNYEFQKYEKEDLIKNNYNAKAYLYVVWIVTKIFWWLPMVKGLKVFQFLIHLAFSVILLKTLPENKKYAFLILYAWNPVVVYLSTFPFYYFYQFVPSALLLLIWKSKMKFSYVVLFFVLLGFLLNVRLTILFIVGLSIWVIYSKYGIVRSFLCTIILAGVFLFSKSSDSTTSVWHTMYVGIGAYPNEYLPTLSDFSGVDLYKKVTGFDLKDVNERDINDYKKYGEVCKAEYIRILKQSPFLLFRNASINFFQSFSFGHFANRGLAINLVSAFMGLVCATFLIVRKKWFYIFAIALSAGGYVLYFPPNQQYMFGSFVLIIYAIIDSIVIKKWLFVVSTLKYEFTRKRDRRSF